MRFEVRDGDQWSEDISRPTAFNRAELSCAVGHITGATEVWFSFAVRMWGLADNPTISGGYRARTIFQVFNAYPQLQLTPFNDGTELWTYAMVGSDPDVTVKTTRHTGAAMQDGVTEQFVFRCVFSPTVGELQMWRGGVEQCDLSGLDMGYTGTDWARPKFGIYKLASAATVRAEFVNFKLGADLSAKVATPDALPSGW